MRLSDDPQPGGRPPAPAELGLLQAFLNTRWDLGTPDHPESLTDPAALRDWLAVRGLSPASRELSGPDLERALAVREGLRALAFANNGHELDRPAVASLDRASAGAAVGIRIEPGGPRFDPADAPGVGPALGALLAIVARAMLDGSWTRLKACPGRDCGWVFYDVSRNGSSRWCSMSVCGDRQKSRAYYRRRVVLRSPR